jgi:hypothetical protein
MSELHVSTSIMVKWLALLLYIRKGPSSNLILGIGYPDFGFSWFYLVSPGKW